MIVYLSKCIQLFTKLSYFRHREAPHSNCRLIPETGYVGAVAIYLCWETSPMSELNSGRFPRRYAPRNDVYKIFIYKSYMIFNTKSYIVTIFIIVFRIYFWNFIV